MSVNSKFRLTLRQRRSVAGYMFSLPLILGFIFFFAYPFYQSIVFSLSQLTITRDGYELLYIGLENYRHALLVDPNFVQVFTETVVTTVSNVPLILAFSFFAAVLLNQKFRGRTLARVIFFLPVILSAGVVLKLESADYMTGILGVSDDSAFFFGDAALQNFLLYLRLPETLLLYIVDAVHYIPEVIKASGIQILIFLAGLQSISPTLYEAADVEGATAWENFWLITLPLLSPLILTNIVYTIIDSFTRGDNALLIMIRQTAFGGAGYGVSTAMAWLYFLVIFAILAVSIGLISRMVFYER